jgi:uncharacterized membrane protein
MKQTAQTDINHTISRILLIGIRATTVFYLAGVILLIISGENALQLHNFGFPGITEFFNELAKFKPKPFFLLGTVSLIMTPILRVFLSLYFFYKQKEKNYVVVTFIVASVISISILLGVIFSLKLG